MENEKLKEILKLHKMWLNDEEGGKRANLSRADLSNADLIGAELNGAKLPMFCKWYTGIIDNKIQIGCKVKSIEEWEAFLNSDEVIQTPRNTPEFKQIEATIRAYIAYLTTLNK